MLFGVLGSAHQLEQRLEAALAEVGLSMAKGGALRALAAAAEPLTLSELAGRMRCVRSNITQLVDRLEKDGLVRRVNDSADRRVRRASLTPAGRKAHAEATRVVQAQERAVAGALRQADAKALTRALGLLRS